ncbi:MAG: hypothetical protein UT77_C0017G0010 [Candidatus Daviesbacteria bacterium GW2011_GWC2_40_12]|uniref:DUF5667 domain-containing protein n=1 Tax=Candidatus Daviesbacteria bacterium GW2011_GWC2_40_12 TaxID=1618431 RepID=A0A0G0T1H8_9BACT|nr:MAG: hypothetical protein UT77_C0017G0010 [Candidatus Daviesbacteria bacterium GW2011_GWC2_40_12]
MTCPKKTLTALVSLLLTVVFGFFPVSVYASQKQYFDWGPYYQSSQVLGFTFSALEDLPSLKIPDNLNLPKAGGILPDSPFYLLEKVVENTQLTFTFDPVNKEELRLSIAAERLAEAKTLMDQGKIQAASQALGDYGRTINDITQNLTAITKTNTPQSQDLINKVEQAAAAQTVVAAALSLATPPAQAEGWTDAGNAARDVLDKIAEVKGEPAIPENLSNGLQQLKEQGLISEEESNKIYGLKNRSEVREELIKLNSAGGLPPSEIARLDESVSKYYPEIQNQQIANWQVVELRSYQAQTQPNEKQVEALKKWQENPDTPPSNDIKPYLWYNRAQDLAKEVDLSNFSQNQQADLSKYYPQAQDNPTYSPPPASTRVERGEPSPTPSPAASPSPSGTPVPADPYLQDPGGALPGQPTYIIKQFGEGLGLTFTIDPVEKAKLRFEYAERRLAEAAALSKDPKKANLYQSALEAYQTALADASNFLKNLPEGKAARIAAEKLEAQAGRHEVVFEKGLLPPPANNPKLLAEIIKTTEDALDRSADTLERPALPPALASRLDDLKAQGLILEEEAQNLVNSNSRQKGFPLADAKKMDEAQSQTSPADYNQLVEVRKVEELQNLRAVQTDLAQTPTLKQQVSQLGQKAGSLESSFDPSLIKPEDLGGRENLVKAYEKLASVPRPINGGQFGPEATPGATPAPAPEDEGSLAPKRRDVVLSACPEGAAFKQSEGCVWADSGKKINDYDQYKCDGPRQYYSFAAKKCLAYDPTKGYQEDSRPICPVGYQWSWQTQSCQTGTGGILPYPSPSAQPEPKDDKEREERSKSCPEGSSYQAPNGCVWDKNGKPVLDTSRYGCSAKGQYYSFEQQKCINLPKPGEAYPDDFKPACKDPNTYWSWDDGKCIQPRPIPLAGKTTEINIPKPFITPDSPFYIIKQAAERVQYTVAFTPQARGQASLAQAKERLAEAADALKRNDEVSFKKSIDSYTSTMQNIVSDTSKEQLTEGAKKEIGKLLSEKAAEQNLLLEKLKAWAPKEQDTSIDAAVSVSILGVDKAADIAGEPPIPDEVKSKIEGMPEKMISEEDKKKLLEINSRVDARLKLGSLIANGALTQTDAGFLNEDFDAVDKQAKLKVEELKKLEEIATASDDKDKLVEKVEKNEETVRQLTEFEKTFEAGQDVPVEIRPYVRLTRINEVAQTVRPDIVKLEDFQNRKDVVLAVATLQEEFKPTKEAWDKVEDFRRRNPGTPLPPELARTEALSFRLGVRNQAESCYLPTPPFAPNTPCPAPGAAIPITSYANYIVDIADRDFPVYRPGYRGPNTGYNSVEAPSLDKDGKAFVYGQGPKPESSGVCSDGYHWMYDSGGWCMSNSGSYGSSYNYTPSGPQTAGYTPYSPYYNAPGAPPATYGYPAGGNYPGSPYSYSPPSYYGPGSTTYTTNPPAGTVPGSGPKPTAPGQCPSGFHWMSDSGGWCMADGPTYVPSGTAPSGSLNCGSQGFNPSTGRCNDGACPGGSNWDGSKCVSGGIYPGSNYPSCPPGQYYSNGTCVNSSTGSVNCGSGYTWNGYSCQPSSGQRPSCSYPAGGCPGIGAWYDYSSCSCRTSTTYTPPSSYEYGCTPGSYWDGSKCVKGSYEGPGWSDREAQDKTWCQPPSGGCGSGWFDYGTCSCKTPTINSTPTYYRCQPPSGGCGSGWFDYGSCSCKQSSSQGCSNVSSSSCPSGWYFDSSACTCRQSSTSGSCPSGSHWMSENGGYCMSDAERDAASTGGSTTSGSSGSSSGTSCPSGYHLMDNSWCMSDAERDGGSSGGGGSTSTTSSPAPAASSEPAPAASSAPATSSEPAPAAPPPPSEPAPAPAAPAPAP